MYNEFLKKNVNVGIPNFVRPNRLFFITGTVVEVDKSYLTLRIKDGIRRIPLSDVIQISLSKEGNYIEGQ
jgi:hypothetical protein